MSEKLAVAKHNLRKIISANKGDKYGRGHNPEIERRAKEALDALEDVDG